MAEASHPPAEQAHAGAAANGAHAATTATTEDHGGAAAHVEPTAWGFDAGGWVALAMVAVFAILIWKRVPALIGTALDRKIAGISEQLDEAAKLRGEAEALKGEYEAKAAAAGQEAATMIERARAEADGIVAKAEADAAALVERRTRMAEDKIAAAERAAVDEVRARAAAAAAAAAEALIREKLDAGADKPMVDSAIEGLAGG